MEKLSSGWGTFLKYKMLTDTRPFDLVETALRNSGIAERHADTKLLEHPKASTAFTRSMNYLSRVCMASIPFPAGSPNLIWEEADGTKQTGERNPNYSLKIESVKGTPKGELAYRINISDRRRRDENMAHVLTVTFRPGMAIEVLPGNPDAWDRFGEDLAKMCLDANQKFLNNYNDEDIRDIVVKELTALKALNVLGKTTNFIARDTDAAPDNTVRAEALMKFIRDCGHLANILGLDGETRTRDAIVDELRASILADMDEYEQELDAKLNTKTVERKRGEDQRARMMNTANKSIDRIMALADYHSTVLGVMAEGIRERAEGLRKKATEFLTRDFGSGGGVASTGKNAALAKRVAELEAENAKLRSPGGGLRPVDPFAVVPAKDAQAGVIVSNTADPFADQPQA